MLSIPHLATFEQWRTTARQLARAHIPPQEIAWTPAPDSLFAAEPSPLPTATTPLTVPKQFLPQARTVFHHRSVPVALISRILYRLTHGSPHLLDIPVDDDIHPFLLMEKAVRRDAHKTKAFVRFRKAPPDAPEPFVAYHRPDHRVLPLVADFFTDRFHDTPWRIITPDSTAIYDGTSLTYAPGAGPSTAPKVGGDDDMEEFWRTYYSSIFNPARLKLHAMTKEMPKKHWQTLPEATVIDPLIHAARTRVSTMIDKTADAQTAADFLPQPPFTLPQLKGAATRCQGCDLCHHATHTVFGEGPANARIMVIGEQPGDHEDLQARPFVGPAGQLLMQTLTAVGLPRDELYLTNAVKHFKWTPDERGKRRLHKTPGWSEVAACRPWLAAELSALNPQYIVTLGATAAKSLLGPTFKLTPNLHRWQSHQHHQVLPLLHPAAILRMPDPERQAALLADFTQGWRDVSAKLHAP